MHGRKEEPDGWERKAKEKNQLDELIGTWVDGQVMMEVHD